MPGPVRQNHREGETILQLTNRKDPFSEDKYIWAQTRCSPKGGKSQTTCFATGLFTKVEGRIGGKHEGNSKDYIVRGRGREEIE